MATILTEGFSWTTSIAELGNRYNSTFSIGSLIAVAGRFTGNALRMNSQTTPDTFNLRSTLNPTLQFGVAFFPANIADAATKILEVNDGATVQISVTINTDGRIRVNNGGGALIGTGTLIARNNAWNYFGLVVTINNTTGVVKTAINGVADLNLTNVDSQNSGATQATSVRLFGGVTNTVAFCDMFVGDESTIRGERRVSLLTPTADGSVNAWTPSTGTSHFALVDEIPPNSDTDYLSSATAGQQELFAFSNLPYTPAGIDCVQVSCFARKDDAGTREIATLVRSGGTTYTGTTQGLVSSYSDFYLQIYDTNPDTAAAWTGAEVDGAEFGFACVT